MKNSHFKAILGAVGASAIMMSSPAMANFSWTASGQECGSTFSCDRSANISGEIINVEVTGYQATGINTALTTSRVNVWDGLAVQSSGETYSSAPQHATDNNGNLEGILFSFNKAVDITSITMGWHEDSDFSLLRYTGNNNTPLTATSTFGNIEGSGWDLVGNYLYSSSLSTGTDITASVYRDFTDDFVGPQDGTNTDLAPAHTSSSYWLVAAMNDAFWDNPAYTINDYFKLKSLGATYTAPPPPPTGVPEPSTLALMSISIAAFGFTQRRRRKAISS